MAPLYASVQIIRVSKYHSTEIKWKCLSKLVSFVLNFMVKKKGEFRRRGKAALITYQSPVLTSKQKRCAFFILLCTHNFKIKKEFQISEK